MSTDRPTLIVADDHRPMREAIAESLTQADFDVIGQADDAYGAMELARTLRPDICLLDISMPGDGITAARSIAAEVPETTIVMLTVLVDDEHLFEALRAGARGYLVKGSSPTVIAASLHEVLRGEPALSPGLAMRVLEQFGHAETRRVRVPDRGFVQLSRREAEVLEMLRQGLTTATIARRLSVSAVTVRTHISSVMKKVRASDRRELLQILEG